MIIRLFKEGTHNGYNFTAQSIKDLHHNTSKADVVPIVLGHPKNNLPVVGKAKVEDFVLYEEDGKQAIGIDRDDIEVSEGFLDFIKNQKHDKVSVRITKDGVIGHIGLVENAAVLENNYQEFDNKKPYDRYFSSDSEFSVEKKIGFWEKVNAVFKKPNTKKEPTTDNNKKTDKEKEFANENTELKKELTAMKYKSLLKDFEKELEAKELEGKVTPKIKEQLLCSALKRIENNNDFNQVDFSDLLDIAKSLPKSIYKKPVTGKEFGKAKNPLENEIKNQFKNLK